MDSSADSFQTLVAEHSAYLELEKHPAWGAYNQRIHNILKGLQQQLEWGTEDKFGRSHDEEKRAVIHTLKTILAYPALVHTTFEREMRRRQAEEARRQPKDGPIHGTDLPGPSLFDFLNT